MGHYWREPPPGRSAKVQHPLPRYMEVAKTMMLDACGVYLKMIARSLINERGDEIVAELRTKFHLQMEIREGELGRPLTSHEVYEIFDGILTRFARSRHFAETLYRKERSS